MHPKPNRLPLSQEKNSLQTQGKSVFAKNLKAVYKPNLKNHIRVSTIISKKVFKNATDRNSLNRRLLHACRQTIPDSLAIDLLLLPRAQLSLLSDSDLKSTVNQIYTQINHEIHPHPTN